MATQSSLVIQRIKLATLVLALCLGEFDIRATTRSEQVTANPLIILETTKGIIKVELFPDRAPHTTTNFVELVNNHFYDGLIFHRVLVGFVIQTGGFDIDLVPQIRDKAIPNESFNGLLNEPGSLAMAREKDPNSAMAQFFINMNFNRHLDAQPGVPGYTVFGKVVSGYDVAEHIELSDTQLTTGMVGVPVHPIQIIRAYVVE